MTKISKIVIGIVLAMLVITIIIVAVILLNKNEKSPNLTDNKNVNSNLKINSINDLQTILINVYGGYEQSLPQNLKTSVINLDDAEQLKNVTGLSTSEGIEYGLVSEPNDNTQAYSLVILKTIKKSEAEKIAKKMSESVNASKWENVSAERIYATSSGDVVFLVMSSRAVALPIYENFKSIAGAIGDEYKIIK